MKYEYYIETYFNQGWVKIITGSRDFCEGWLSARMDISPRPCFQLVRSDGRTMRIIDPKYDVSIGQVAGFPTAEQYERAAREAMGRARAIRDRETRNNPAPI